MAFDDGITVAFAFGDVTLTPVPGIDNLLEVEQNGNSTMIGTGQFSKLVNAGLFPEDGLLELAPEMEERGASEPKRAISMGRFEIINYKDGSLGIHIAPDYGIESNFSFYIDGWTLKGNSGGDTFDATSPTGDHIQIKSSILTAFLERRLESAPLSIEDTGPV